MTRASSILQCRQGSGCLLALCEEKEKQTIINKSVIEDLENKVKYYQHDNSRLSNEVVTIQNKYEMIKNNLTNVEDEKNKIFKQKLPIY